MTAEFTADLAVLMPKFDDERMFSVRYEGLEAELRRRDVLSCFVESHVSYDAANGQFIGYFNTDLQRSAAPVRPALVRDLTMPEKPETKPLYQQTDIRLVHTPQLNSFLRDKTNIFKALPEEHPSTLVIDEKGLEFAFNMIQAKRILTKPIIGMASKGVQVHDTPTGVTLKPGMYLAQEYIDTTGGMPELGIEGMHNLRVLSIGSKAIGGIGRVGGDGTDILANDSYGAFVGPDELPAATQAIVTKVHDFLRGLPGAGKNVLAIDVMRGIDGANERREVLCDLNRRPMRIGRWDVIQKWGLDDTALLEIGRRWDKAEAEMLAGLLN